MLLIFLIKASNEAMDSTGTITFGMQTLMDAYSAFGGVPQKVFSQKKKNPQRREARAELPEYQPVEPLLY